MLTESLLTFIWSHHQLNITRTNCWTSECQGQWKATATNKTTNHFKFSSG